MISRIPPIAILLWVAACDPVASGGMAGNGDVGPDNRPPLVRVAPVELRMVQRVIETTSFLESEHRVTVLSEVPGKVLKVLVDEGDQVKAGQLLARLDDRESQAALQAMQVQLESRKVEKELNKLEVEAALRRVQQAMIERDQAKSEYERNAGIARDVVSPKVLQDSRYAFAAAEEAVLVAEFNEKKAELDVERAANTISEVGATIEEMGLRLEDHKIMAPLTGVLEARYIKGGETISSATELFVVVDPVNLMAYLNRPQRELALAQKAVEVRFTADTYPGEEFIASVDLVSPVVDQSTGSFRLRVRVVGESSVNKLLPGMFIRARIMTEDLREALMLPKSAVLSEGDVAMVFAVRDGKANRVALDPGLETEDYVECRNRGDDGLNPGDLVVVVGHEDLKDQAQVDIAKD